MAQENSSRNKYASIKKVALIENKLFSLVVGVLLFGIGALAIINTPHANSAAGNKPNIIMIMTDDQRFDMINDMPNLRKELLNKGVNFKNAYVSLPQCCPSRATFLTGQYVHNHNLWKTGDTSPDAVIPGGHGGFLDKESSTLPVWLKESGYSTALFGKYLNNYPSENDDNNTYVPEDRFYVPPGWDYWGVNSAQLKFPKNASALPSITPQKRKLGRGYKNYTLMRSWPGLASPFNASYFSHQGENWIGKAGPDNYNQGYKQVNRSVYATTELTALGKRFIDKRKDDPFFLFLSYQAPHMFAQPEDKYKNSWSFDLISTTQNRKTNGYSDNWNNLEKTKKPKYIRDLPNLNKVSCDEVGSYLEGESNCADGNIIRKIEIEQRRTLLSLDDQIKKLYDHLRSTKDENGVALINSTYVVFVSDHGFMLGEHRIPHNKLVPYEESIRIPMIISGPGISKKSLSVPVSNVDVVPTILDMVGRLDNYNPNANNKHPLDGESLLPLLRGQQSESNFIHNVRIGVLAEGIQGRMDIDGSIVYGTEGENVVLNRPTWASFIKKKWKLIEYDDNHSTVKSDPLGIDKELYHLQSDPSEIYNLGFDPSYTSQLRIIKRQLDQIQDCVGTNGERSCSIPLGG